MENTAYFILSNAFNNSLLIPISAPGFKQSKESRSPDNDIFRHLGLTYSRKNEKMFAGQPCPGDSYAEAFQNGITNGAAWYPLTGK
jgi:hypothetical protein